MKKTLQFTHAAIFIDFLISAKNKLKQKCSCWLVFPPPSSASPPFALMPAAGPVSSHAPPRDRAWSASEAERSSSVLHRRMTPCSRLRRPRRLRSQPGSSGPGRLEPSAIAGGPSWWTRSTTLWGVALRGRPRCGAPDGAFRWSVL